MLISICGTPGCGKTTLGKALRVRGFEVISIKDLIEEKGWHEGWDENSSSLIVDKGYLRRRFNESFREASEKIFIEGHLSYLAPSDLIVVLRCNPNIIASRLSERGYDEPKVKENAEAEGLSSILVEAIAESSSFKADGQRIDKGSKLVVERDVTGMAPDSVADWVLEMVDALQAKDLILIDRYRPGSIDWTDVMAEWF